MTREEFNGLQVGDCVRVKRSGKLYVARWVTTAAEHRARAERYNAEDHGWSTYRMDPDAGADVTFLQWKDGREYGALRSLNPEAIDRAEREETIAQVRRLLPLVWGGYDRAMREERGLCNVQGSPDHLEAQRRTDEARERAERLQARLVELENGQD